MYWQCLAFALKLLYLQSWSQCVRGACIIYTGRVMRWRPACENGRQRQYVDGGASERVFSLCAAWASVPTTERVITRALSAKPRLIFPTAAFNRMTRAAAAGAGVGGFIKRDESVELLMKTRASEREVITSPRAHSSPWDNSEHTHTQMYHDLYNNVSCKPGRHENPDAALIGPGLWAKNHVFHPLKRNESLPLLNFSHGACCCHFI